jgi:VIT1/CCC1 family predicted Fe2+/Mn2+ transporter
MSPSKDAESVWRWRALLASERDAVVVYSQLAEAEAEAEAEAGERQQIFRELADIERKHAAEALGSPWGAAGSSPLAFAIGAFVVVVPYLIGGRTAALLTAIGLAVAALFAVGATIGAVNGRPALRSGLRR